jgi:hypothetical protein
MIRKQRFQKGTKWGELEAKKNERKSNNLYVCFKCESLFVYSPFAVFPVVVHESLFESKDEATINRSGPTSVTVPARDVDVASVTVYVKRSNCSEGAASEKIENEEAKRKWAEKEVRRRGIRTRISYEASKIFCRSSLLYSTKEQRAKSSPSNPLELVYSRKYTHPLSTVLYISKASNNNNLR